MTSVFSLLGIKWVGFNGDFEVTEDFRTRLKYLDKMRKLINYKWEKEPDFQDKDYTSEVDFGMFDISILKITLHHLGDDLEEKGN